MEKLYIISMLVMLINFTACASPKVKFNITVIDAETEKAIENVTAEFLFRDYHAKAVGMGWGTRVVSRTKEEKTNKMGFASAIGEANTANLPIIVNKEGYYEGYPGSAKPKLSHNRALNRWEPWPCAVTVKLRPIKNPVPMYVKSTDWIKVPEQGKPCGYDLEIGDWVAPYGKGQISDFIFKASFDMKSSFEASSLADITFNNTFDGCQFWENSVTQSTFIWPYLAPLKKYNSEINIFKKFKDGKYEHTDGIASRIFRVRTKIDSFGNIIAANYGILNGNIELDYRGKIRFSYHFNPDNKSRSLEYSGKNLFKARDQSGRLK